MRFLISAGLVLLSIPIHATELRIFAQDIKLRSSCSLEIKHSDGTMEVKALPFRNRNKCAVLPLSATNVPRLEFMHGAYVFLVESQIPSKKNCQAELVAVISTSDGKVEVGSKIQKTAVCGYGERKDFEILFHHASK